MATRAFTIIMLTYISYSTGQEVHNLRVWHAHCAGPVDVDDPVSHSHTTPLSNGASDQRADLKDKKSVTLINVTFVT